MGRLANLTAELPRSEVKVSETVEVIRRTVEALAGAGEMPVCRVRVPSGGGKAFEFPGETPDAPEYVTSFTGVVINAAFTNAHWEHGFGEAGASKEPLCVSRDGLTGYDAGGVERSCRACPWNRMGSRDGGRGKACRNMAELLVMVEGEPLPVLLRVPTMSLANWSMYVARTLSPRGLAPWQVATRFSLTKATNAAGIEYSQVCFQCAGRVDDAEVLPLMGAISPMIAGTLAEAVAEE